MGDRRRSSQLRRPGLRAAPIAALAAASVVALLVLSFAGGGRPASAAPRPVPLEPGTQAIVRADGDCLRMREAPGLGGDPISCIAEGTVVDVLDGAIESDGYRWQRIRAGGVTGWSADEFLEPLGSAPPGGTVSPPAPTAPVVLTAPPEGGLTLGLSGTSDPAALADAQPFAVESVSVLDLVSQRFRVYVPGAPAHVNSLQAGLLQPGDVVTVKRAGAPPPVGPAPAPSGAAPSGSGRALAIPPAGGLSQGVAGTNDPSRVAAAQPFAVESVAMLDVASQRWLVHVPGAPAHVSSLGVGALGVDDIVTVKRRAAAAPPPAGGTAAVAPPEELPDGQVPGPAGNEPP